MTLSTLLTLIIFFAVAALVLSVPVGLLFTQFSSARDNARAIEILRLRELLERPVDMILFCPQCHLQHIDRPGHAVPEWTNPPHRSHLCHGCGHIWRPADIATNGVAKITTRGSNDP